MQASGFRIRASALSLQRGFTLLEVLVSIAILGIAVTIVLQLFSANLRAISASEDYVSAAIKAEVRMREILEGEELSEKAWNEVTDDGYSMDIEISETLKERTEGLQVRLMQINLTVRWKKGEKYRALTLSSMKTVKRQV